MCNKCNKPNCDCNDDAFIRRGPRGKQGPKGATGTGVAVPGPQGVPGPTGPAGPGGAKGDTGLSAYQVWLGQGITGSQQVFLDSLKGTNGGFPSVNIGTTTTLPSGTPAHVNTAGSTPSNVVLNFGIPTGPKGDTGDKGDKGDPGAPGANCMIFKNEAGTVLVPGSYRVLGSNNFDGVTSIEISKTSMLGYSGTVATANNAEPWVNSIAIESTIQLTNTADSTNFGIFKVASKNTTGIGVVLVVNFIAGNGIANAANSELTICYNVPCIAEPANVNPEDECGGTGGTGGGTGGGGGGSVTPAPGSGCGCFPVGMIAPFAGSAAPPDGWLECNGTAKSSGLYPALAAVLGTTYGTSAPGTFKLPNLNGKVIAGPGNFGTTIGNATTGQSIGDNDVTETIPLSVTGQLDSSNLPSHTHSLAGADGATVAISAGGDHHHTVNGWEYESGGEDADSRIPWPDMVVLHDNSDNTISEYNVRTDYTHNGTDKILNPVLHSHPATDFSGATAAAGVGQPQPFDLDGNANIDFPVVQATMVMRYMIKF